MLLLMQIGVFYIKGTKLEKTKQNKRSRKGLDCFTKLYQVKEEFRLCGLAHWHSLMTCAQVWHRLMTQINCKVHLWSFF